jgi:hypothetical protein
VSADKTRTLREAEPAPGAARPGVLVLFSEAGVAGDGVYPVPRGEVTIGRDPSRTVFVEDHALSRLHAVIAFPSSGEARLRDAGSHNGTQLNGARIAGETAVVAGDVIRCGSTILTLVADASAFGGWRRHARQGELVGGPALRRVLADAAAFAPTSLEVLIAGESGTGRSWSRPRSTGGAAARGLLSR